MNRRNRTLIVVGIAVVLAGLAAFGVLRVLQNRPVVQVQVAERHVLVATRDLPMGTMLAPDMVRLQAWPAESLVPGSFTKPEEVTNRGVISDIFANEPIYVGLASGLVVFVIGSLMSKPTDPEILAEWDRRSRGEAPELVPATT